MDGAADILQHASAVALGSRCALIRGRSGSGKSDLALRCLALGQSPLWAGRLTLVADDQVVLRRDGNRLIARAPEMLANLMEVRGLGIITVPATNVIVEVALIVDLVAPAEVVRLPEPQLAGLLGLKRPLLRLAPFEASAPVKLAVALELAAKG